MSVLPTLPSAIQEEVMRYRLAKDRQRAIAGKLLLMMGLESLGIPHNGLSDWSRNVHQRPQLPMVRDFNISHAGDKVLCVLSQDVRVGVDIEQVIDLPLEDFNNHFTPIERNLLRFAKDPLQMFYWLWTRKEAVVKADGRGLKLPLNAIEVSRPVTWLNGQCWHLQDLPCEGDYVGHITCSKTPQHVEIHPELNGSDMVLHFQTSKCLI